MTYQMFMMFTMETAFFPVFHFELIWLQAQGKFIINAREKWETTFPKNSVDWVELSAMQHVHVAFFRDFPFANICNSFNFNLFNS